MRRISVVGGAAVGALVALSALAASAGTWKLLGISWVAFLAMALGIPLGRRSWGGRSWALVWGYGLAAGAMVTSAAVFLVPQAIGHHTTFGGFGIALGLLIGFAGHTIGHRLAHYDFPLDRTAAALTAHSLSAGVIIGIVYGNMPELGPVLGLAIVSHKGPAGYAAARRLAANDRDPTLLLLPAAGVGIAAIVSSLIQLPAVPALRGVVFGFAAGLFLHVAMDFLPRCEIGSDVHELLTVSGDAHELLDQLRVHAVLSTGLGGVAVFLAWLLVS
ncbi:zinc transporter, ZIP family [Haloplanus vescus]|uniref:Zinc transporter, ZIP family n=1 Tax=Haloplanus vescus TaxID=555874 RepID=A0A1H3YNU3_9EURY|nr:ZIP family metal transporter [Haloplanus vescus]SEA12861.1 zinc transporter, ZIP family [Haloplanus vescus]